MDGVYYDDKDNLLGIVPDEEDKTRHDLISRCDLFNELAHVPAKADAVEYAGKVFSIIQQMPTIDAEEAEMEDYKIRMIEEYKQLKDRYQKLHKMTVKYEAGTLDFEPSCPLDLLKRQKRAMGEYLNVLEIRAKIENVELDAEEA